MNRVNNLERNVRNDQTHHDKTANAHATPFHTSNQWFRQLQTWNRSALHPTQQKIMSPTQPTTPASRSVKPQQLDKRGVTDWRRRGCCVASDGMPDSDSARYSRIWPWWEATETRASWTLGHGDCIQSTTRMINRANCINQ